ncbi:hypothetical protein TSOC_014128, partial [Tetrabaena socialis]
MYRMTTCLHPPLTSFLPPAPRPSFVHPISLPRRRWMVVMFCLMAALLFADQNLLAPNLTEAAAFFGMDERQKDTLLGGALMAAFFAVGAPAALLVGWLTDRGGIERRTLLFWVVVIGETPCLLTYWGLAILLSAAFAPPGRPGGCPPQAAAPVCPFRAISVSQQRSAALAALRKPPAHGRVSLPARRGGAQNFSAWSLLVCQGLDTLFRSSLAGSSQFLRVKSFWQFFLLRALTGVAVGGCFPLVFSLLGDLFPPARRTAVSAVVQIATGLGLAVGQVGGG